MNPRDTAQIRYEWRCSILLRENLVASHQTREFWWTWSGSNRRPSRQAGTRSRRSSHQTRELGGPGRDRTDDLFHAISLNEVFRPETEREQTSPGGSVHAAPTHCPCLATVLG